jgi:hypothetical protein
LHGSFQFRKTTQEVISATADWAWLLLRPGKEREKLGKRNRWVGVGTAGEEKEQLGMSRISWVGAGTAG